MRHKRNAVLLILGYLDAKGYPVKGNDPLSLFLHDFFSDRWEEDLTEKENIESINEDLVGLIRSLNENLDLGLNI